MFQILIRVLVCTKMTVMGHFKQDVLTCSLAWSSLPQEAPPSPCPDTVWGCTVGDIHTQMPPRTVFGEKRD